MNDLSAPSRIRLWTVALVALVCTTGVAVVAFSQPPPPPHSQCRFQAEDRCRHLRGPARDQCIQREFARCRNVRHRNNCWDQARDRCRHLMGPAYERCVNDEFSRCAAAPDCRAQCRAESRDRCRHLRGPARDRCQDNQFRDCLFRRRCP